MGEQRNLLLAIVIAVGIILLYQLLVLDRINPAPNEAPNADGAPAAASEEAPGLREGDAPQVGQSEAPAGAAGGSLDRETALGLSDRVEIRTPALSGSIALTGARFDDLQLLRYDTEVDSDIPVTLLTPREGPGGHYVVNGWAGGTGAPDGMPGVNTDWRLAEGDVLTPQSPIVLEHRAGDLVFQRTITVDEDYLFTVTDRVANEGDAPAAIARYGQVRQHGLPADLTNFFILHEGPIGVVGGELTDRKYNALENDGVVTREGQGGWMGITSKYWLAAAAPAGEPAITGQFRTLRRDGATVYESNYIRQAETVAPGAVLESQAYVYAGSKSVEILQRYQDEYGVQRLDMAMDWGMFWFLTRPFFFLIDVFNGWLGNFGLAIMLLTVLIKLVLFPLNNRAFASMAKMKAVAPKMQEIKETYQGDNQRQQQAMMELYRKEKINPLAGCLPILPQIPIFFALYKTVFISLEARHEPFFGWIRDMSAPDPTMIGNLFGLLPYDPSGIPLLSAVLTIGLWPILMGITMWAQQSLNPPPPDKIQRQIFAFLPIVFTIVLAPFAAALVIYWAWNNFLTILQQYIIMRRQGVETELDKKVKGLHARLTGKPVQALTAEGEGGADGSKLSSTTTKPKGVEDVGTSRGEAAPDSYASPQSDTEAGATPDAGDEGGVEPLKKDGEPVAKGAAKPAAKRTNPAAKKPRSSAKTSTAKKKPARKPAPKKKTGPRAGAGTGSSGGAKSGSTGSGAAKSRSTRSSAAKKKPGGSGGSSGGEG